MYSCKICRFCWFMSSARHGCLRVLSCCQCSLVFAWKSVPWYGLCSFLIQFMRWSCGIEGVMVERMSSNSELHCVGKCLCRDTSWRYIYRTQFWWHRILGNAFIVVVLAVEQAWGEAEAHRTYWPIPSWWSPTSTPLSHVCIPGAVWLDVYNLYDWWFSLHL